MYLQLEFEKSCVCYFLFVWFQHAGVEWSWSEAFDGTFDRKFGGSGIFFYPFGRGPRQERLLLVVSRYMRFTNGYQHKNAGAPTSLTY